MPEEVRIRPSRLRGVKEAARSLGEIVDDVARTGEPIVITKRGKPVVIIAQLEKRPDA